MMNDECGMRNGGEEWDICAPFFIHHSSFRIHHSQARESETWS